ncbi:hypothetical protein [Micromonospora sp. WMMD980]|uniref:hypothetical protein n=1 Tax=Micromonospora sp. WMMD980 TaxID=3016088 RepID=UPI002417B758|nr:hypothetical protein [Micromonospora sp. WMMD980]MDG4803265.1 hypothetical protein [Micromonospora sp. WMMD980]
MPGTLHRPGKWFAAVVSGRGGTTMRTDHPAPRIVTVKPVPVPTTGRDLELAVKVTAPATGDHLPVIVFSHGNAWSVDGYEPLVDRWAAAGFAVVQPTRLDSRRHGIGFDDPRFGTIWRVDDSAWTALGERAATGDGSCRVTSR